MQNIRKFEELTLLEAKPLNSFSISNESITANNLELGSLLRSLQPDLQGLLVILAEVFHTRVLSLELAVSIVSCFNTERLYGGYSVQNVLLALRNY